VTGLAHPALAPPLLAAWAVLALLCAFATWRARRWLAALGAGARSGAAGGGRDALLLAALLAIVAALVGPQLGTRRVALPGGGVDLVVLIDVSRSMDATDAAPSRLVRAREAARAVLATLAGGDRAALAVFAGHGVLLTPLTHDVAALEELLPALDTEWMADRGSRFAAGVEAALAAFEHGSERPRVLLALGDGERAQLAADALFARLADAGVRVVAGAVGSDEGTTLMGPAGPLRDANGRAVVTRRDTRGFARFAAASGGALLVSDAFGALDARALAAAVRGGHTPGPDGTLVRELPATHTAAPAALAFALLLVEWLGGGRWRRRRTARLARGPARAALVALALLALGAGGAEREALEARVARHPEDAPLLVALGVARAEQGDLEEAAHAFAAALVRAREPATLALASYDLGVVSLGLGDLEGARDAFFDALAFDPDDRQAKFNLEWTLRALEAVAAPPPPAPPRAGEGPPEPAPREAAPEPPPRPEPAPAEPAGGARECPPLAPEEVARWLETVRDVPPPALRRAAADGAPRSGPQW
jgi:Ca-activated chloride channel family protein